MVSTRCLRWLVALGAIGLMAVSTQAEAPPVGQEAPAAEPAPPAAEAPAAEPATAPAPAAPEPRAEADTPDDSKEPATIRLQFEGTPYLTVVRRFAQEAGKPLVGDLSITGELTFVDSQPYTYGEALDTLNMILGMRGYLLQEKGRFLVLVRSEDVIRPPGSTRVYHGEAPPSVRPGQIVTVTLPLQFLDADTVVKTFTPMVSKGFGRIAALGRGKSVIVTDTQESIERIRRLLAQIDTGTMVEQQLETFVLKHASAKETADVLRGLMGIESSASGRPTYRMVYNRELGRSVPVRVTDEAGESRVTVAHDVRTNTIIVVGPGDKISLARDLVARLDVPSGAETSDFRIFVLKHHRAEDVAEMIRESVPGKQTERRDSRGRRVGSTTTDRVAVVADPATNRVIVTADRDVMAKVERLIRELDRPGEVAEGLKIFRLKSADPQQLATSLEALLGKSIDPRTRRPGPGGARVTADPRTASLIVAGDASDIQLAERLVAELDIAPEIAGREIRVITLAGGDARELARSLPRLWAEQQVSSGRGRGSTTVSSVRVEADPGTNSLIIAAPPGEWPVLQDLLGKLQAAVAQEATPVTRQFKVEHAPVDELSRALSAVFGGGRGRGSSRSRGGGPQRVPVVIAPAESSRTLLVTASEDDMTTIGELIKALDVPPGDTVEPVRIISLKSADAAQVARTLEAMLPAPQRGQRPSVIIQADPATNTLMLRGSQSERQVLEELIAELDDPSRAEARETRVIPLKRTSARDLVSMLAPLYTGQQVQSSRSRRGRGRPAPVAAAAQGVVITPSPDDGALVVEGPKATVEEIAQLVASVDTGEDAQPIQFRTYSLTGGTSGVDLARSLGRLFAERQGEPSADPPPKFEADAGANQLLVAATDRQFAVIEALIQESIKTGADLESQTVTLPVLYVQPSRIAELLQVMLLETPTMPSSRGRRGGRSSPTPTGDVRVVGMDESKAVVVQGTPDKIALARELLKSLDVPGDETAGVLMVRLQTADARALVETLRGMLPPARRGEPQTVYVEADAASNSVLLRAPETEREQLEALVKGLDQASVDQARELRVIPLEHASARDLVPTLVQLFQAPDASSRSPSRRGRGATPSFEAGPPVIAASPDDKRLLVEGTGDQVGRIADLVTTLDVADLVTYESRTFKLKYATASRVAEVLQVMLSEQAAQQASSRGRGRSGGASMVSVGPGPRVAGVDETNTVVVKARPDQLLVAEELIRSLDVASEDLSPIRMVRVESADAARLAATLEAMVPPPERGRPREIFIQADPGGGAVLIRAPASERDMLERMVAQLDEQAQLGAREMRIIPLKSASARALVSTLAPLYGGQARTVSSRSRRTRSRTPSSAALVAEGVILTPAPDDRALIVEGPKSTVEEIARLVASLDAGDPAETPEFRTYTLTSSSADDLADALEDLFEQQDGQARSGPEPRFEADSGSNQLLVAATAAQFEIIDGLVEKLKAEVELAAKTRTFKLQYAQPTRIAEVLSTMLAEQGVQPSRSRGRRGRSTASVTQGQTRVVGMDEAMSVVVQGTAEKLDLAQKLIRSLDVQDPDDVLPTRIVSLREGTDAAAMAETLRGTLPETPRGQAPKVFIQPAPGRDAILIRAPATEMKQLENVIQTLESDGGLARELRILKLENASAAAVAETIGRLYQPSTTAASSRARSQRGRGRTPPASTVTDRVTIVPSPDDKGLLVEGVREEVKKVASLVERLDTAEAPGTLLVKTIRMPGSDVVEMGRSLGRLFAQQSGGRRTPDTDEPQPRFEGNPATDQIMIVATSEQFELIDVMLKDVVVQGAGPRTKTYRLQYADAEIVAPVLEQMLAETQPTGSGRRGSQAPVGDVRVAALAPTNSVTVQAPADKIALADELIATFDDADVGAGARIVVEIVELENAQAVTLAEAVNAALAAEGASPSRSTRGRRSKTPAASAARVTVTPEVNSNSVLVRGPADEVPGVVAMVKRLDGSGQDVRTTQVRVFALQNGDAVSLERSVGRLFQEIVKQQSGSRRDVPPVPFSIAADERTNSLIVSTTPNHFSVVEQVLKTLDQAPDRPGMEMEYFWLENADASTVAMSLDELYASRKGPDKPVIEADEFANAVTVIARAEDLIKDIRPLIGRFDEMAETSSFQVRVMPLTGVRAAEMARVLQSIYQQMTDSEVVVVEEAGPPRRGLGGGASAPPEPGGGPPRPGEGISPKSGPAEKAPGGSERAPAPKPDGGAAAPRSDAPEKSSSGKAPGHEKPQASAGSGAPGDAPPTIYEAPAEPDELAETEADEPADAAPAEPAARAARPEPQQVTISVDTRTNALVVSGSRQDLDHIQMLLDELLLTIGPDEAEFRVFQIHQADPLAVAQTLDALFNPKPIRTQQQRGNQRGQQAQPPPQPPPVISVAADQRTRSLIVRAKPLDFDIIEPLIKVLDQPSGSASEVRVFPLKNTEAEEVAANLNDLFKPPVRQAQPSQPQQQQRGNQQSRGKSTPQDRRAAAAQEVMEFQSGAGVTQVGGPAPIHITANKATNSVVVSAPPDVMVLIESLIQELDQTISQTTAVRFYPLAHAEVEPTVASLREIFAPGGGTTRRPGQAAAPGDTPIVITGNEAGRQVIVSATPDDQQRIADVVAEIDRAEQGKEFVLRVYKLEYADAGEVAQAISGTLIEGGRPGGRTPVRGGLRVTADRSAGNLLVRATPEDHDRIAQLIQEMDVRPGGDYPVRVIMLKNADPQTVADILNRVFGSGGAASTRGRRGTARGGTTGGQSSAVIEADQRARMVMVRADDETFEAVRALAMQIDANTLSGELAQTLIALEYAKAEAVAPSLAQAFASDRGRTTDPNDRVTVVAEPYSNSLLVTANAENLAKVRSLLEKLDTEQVAAGARTEFLVLQHARAPDLANVLSRVAGGTGGAARGRRGGTTAAEAVVITADASSNALVMSGPSGELDRLIQMARDLDQASQAGLPGVYIIPIEKGDASTAAAMVRDLYNQESQLARRDGRMIEPLAVSADADANAIVLATSKAMYDRVSEWVGRVEKMKVGRGQYQIITLKHADPSEVEQAIRAAFAGGQGTAQRGRRGTSTAGGSQIEIAVLAQQRALVVRAAPEDFERIRNLAETLDREAVGTRGEVRTYALKNAEVGTTVQAVQQLFAPARGGRPRTAAAEVPVIITGDEAARRVIVSATVEDHALIEAVLKELDAAHGQEHISVQVYKVQWADAAGVAQALLASLKSNPRAGEGVRVTAERSSNTVVVRGTAEDHAQVAALLEQVDVNPAEKYPVRTIALENANVEELAAMLGRIFGGTSGGARGRGGAQTGDVIIEANRDSRSLMVRADDPTFEKVRALATDLDAKSTFGEAKQTLLPLQFAQAQSIAASLAEAFAPPRGARVTPEDAVSVVAEPFSNSLIVTANEENLEKVKSLLATLDTEDAGRARTEFLILQYAQATELANVLSRVATGTTAARGGRGATAGQGVVVSADAASNALVMSGPAQEIDKLVAMARDLDQASASSATGVYIIPLENGEAANVAAMVQDLYRQQQQAAQRERRRIDPLAVSADERANAVVLATNQSMYQQVSEWISRVETMTPSRGTMRVIRLQYADPTNVEKAILQLFGDQATSNSGAATGRRTSTQPRGRRGPAGPAGPAGGVGSTGPTGQVETTVIPAQQSILIKASEEDFEEIMRLVALLEAEAEKAKREVRVFPLENALNTQVAQGLNQLYQQLQRPDVPADEVTVTALANTRAVVVAASQEKMPEVESLIKQLDAEEVSPQLEFRIYPLEHAQPTKVLPALQQMLQQVQRQRPGEPINVQADERTRSVIITARGPVFDEVEKIVEALDKPPAYAEANVLVVQLKRADAARLAAVLQDMLRPDIGQQVTDEARALQEQVRRLKVRSADDKEKFVELDLTKPIKITSDPEQSGQQGMNALILSSTPDNLVGLEAVVTAMDRVPLAEGAKVRIIHLKSADAESVVQVLDDIFTQGKALAGKPGSSVAGEAEPETVSGKALVNVLNATADSRTNTVFLSGVEETLALAELIVHDLDRTVGRVVTEVRLYRLKHASAERLVPLLQSVFGEAAAEPGTEGLRTHVTRLRTSDEDGGSTTRFPKVRPALTIQADPATNILIVAARSDLIPLIEDVLKTMDIPGAGTLGSVQIFPLRNADATRIKGVVDGLYAGPNAALIRDADRPNVLVDTRTNALVIAGSQTTLGVLDALLKRLDAPAKPEMRAIKVLPLTNADAQALAPTLQQVMDARVQRLQGLGAAEAEALRAFILADPRSNSLIVGGSPEAYELAKSLAEKLDAAPAALAGQVRLFPLEKTNAGTLSQTLTNLFNQRYQAARAPEIQRQRPIILPDLRTNSLLVAAGADDSRVIEGLLAKLDVELVDPAVQLVVVPLLHNDAGVVGPMIEEIFTARLEAMTPPGAQPLPQDRVDVVADALANALVVSASKENLGLVRGLLEKVDVEPTMAKGIVRMYPLRFADAQRVATMLQGLLADGLYKPGLLAAQNNALLQAREKVGFAVDIRTNVLIVSASPENFAVIEAIVKRVDSEEAYGLVGSIRLYTLQHAEATRLAPTLEQFFDAKRAAEEATGGGVGRLLAVSIIPDARTNTLLVAGGREAFAAVEQMLKRLDASDVTAASEFRVFELKSATAAALQPVLEELFAQRVVREGEERPVTIIADPRANALILGASPDDMRLAESMIARLDREHERPGDRTRVFVLDKADAAQVATTLTNLFQAEGIEGVGVSVDERINAVVISAGAADMARISDLVGRLDTDAVTQVTEIRILQLQNADAEELADLLTTSLTNKPESPTGQGANRQTVLQFVGRTEDGEELVASALQEGVVITPDRRTNSLICLAPQTSMPLLESLVASLDSVSPRFAEIRVYTCQNADAQQMADLLGQLFRLEGAAGEGRAVNYRLVGVEADGMGATLGSAEQYALTLTVDVRTNSLLVGGTKHYADLVLDICQELDTSPAQERMTQIYRLRNAQAPGVEATLRNFLDQERARLEAALGQEGLGAAQRLLEHEVAVVAEENTNALLISASPRYFNTVVDIIRELDTPPPQVLIQVLLAEVRLDDDIDLGVDWNLTGDFGSDDDKTFTVDTTFGPEALFGTTGFSVSVTGMDFGVFLRALQTQGRLEVLSRPSILTADNQEGRITVGQRVPFITNSRVTEEGTTINTIQYENVAIELLVVPRINPDGTVRMEIQPQISSIAESTVEISEGVNAIIVDTREAFTTITVQDGHTIVIGGLITTQESSTESKVPFFGDLPVLGPLFKRTSKSKERRELLIIMTPTVIRTVADSDRTSERELERLNELRSMEEGKAREFRAGDILYPAPLRRNARPPIRDARMLKRGLLVEHEAVGDEADADTDGDDEGATGVDEGADDLQMELAPIPAPSSEMDEP